ncbi:hypothetical protein C7374_105207 [Falsochrobactrum ovis]|uniref:Uncharacterized protein n=1 Tax=Falsochrobactrum ovis TaxID=1293442 RepID=A0A364JVL5_9HYPH|nr:hypothetical protein C7374_105207 [Falsochrobactrum ovis]
MIPTEVPSDTDVNDICRDELIGRYHILGDLLGEFDGAAFAYLLFSAIIPIFIFVCYITGVINQEINLFGSIIVYTIIVSLLSISIYSFIWRRWINRRIKIIDKRLKDILDQSDCDAA